MCTRKTKSWKITSCAYKNNVPFLRFVTTQWKKDNYLEKTAENSRKQPKTAENSRHSSTPPLVSQFPREMTSDSENRYWWPVTTQTWVYVGAPDWLKQINNQSEALPGSGSEWRVISMEFLGSFLWRHFSGKPCNWWRRKMSAVFLRLRTTTLLPIIAAQELVSTTLLTSPFVFAQASSTFCVPSTAGPITSISSFGSSMGKGDATWITKVQSLTALLIKWSIKPHFTITDRQNCSCVIRIVPNTPCLAPKILHQHCFPYKF